MHFCSLKLIHYKNYEQAQLRFSPKVNAILGDNGMGKTNVLDALHYCCLGRSYFSSQDRHVMRREAPFMRLEARIQQDSEQELAVKLIPGKLKELAIDKKAIDRLSDHIGRYPCVVIAPIDVQVLLAASADRRKFVDHTLIQFDKAYLQALIAYDRLLRQRNALLKQMAENRTFNAKLLDTYTVPMASHATLIHQRRAEFCEQLAPAFEAYYQHISGDREKAELRYSSQLAEHELSDLFAAHVEKDRHLARTTCGVHKDDLTFWLDQQALKTYASQGQLKSYILALKLAQYQVLRQEVGKAPLLLLDDIFDKLDDHRVSHLLDLVTGPDFGQVMITDTSLSKVPEILKRGGKDFATFEVHNAQITPVK